MAQAHRLRTVSTVNRAYSTDPHESIDAIGGVNPDHTRWRLTQDAAIAAIEAGTDRFLVDAGGVIVSLIVHTHKGQKYLKQPVPPVAK
ncbi:MAG: hypothetical protein RL324_733 [Verrucomicrobiota bacterium]|jgi:hypothetical protein